jgi:DNA-binding NarL/FixJ family response regulator
MGLPPVPGLRRPGQRPSRSSSRRRPGPGAPRPELAGRTAREREVLAALGRGLSDADIAAGCAISEATAKTHVSRVLAKLGCSSRVRAAILAKEAGLG